MGTIVLIALYGGYLMLFVGLAGLWLWRPAVRWSANSDAAGRSLLDITDPVPMTGGDNPPAPHQGSAEQPSLQCSFCGKTQVEVAKLIAGPRVYICDECVTAGLKVLRSTLPREPDDRPHPTDVVAALDRALSGHTRAKSTLAVAAWRHVGRCQNSPGREHQQRFDALLAGATQATRRRLITTLVDACDVPLIALDAPEILIGGDRMEALRVLLLAVYEPFEDCHTLPACILYMDNIDRIGNSPLAGPFQRWLVGIIDGRQRMDWEFWRAPIGDSIDVQLVCGGDFDGLGQDGREIAAADLERFGLCRLLASRMSCIAVLDAQDSTSRSAP